LSESASARRSVKPTSEWLQAYQETQRAITEAQASYQRMMADSHLGFLKTVEASFSALSVALGSGATSVEPLVARALEQQPGQAVEAEIPDVGLRSGPVAVPGTITTEARPALAEAPPPHAARAVSTSGP